MTKLTAKQVVEWLGGAAVIASLLLVAYEIRQSNRIALATTEVELRNSLAQFNETVYTNPELAQFFVKFESADVELTAAEVNQAWTFIGRAVNSWLAIETAYESGLVSETSYRIAEDDMRAWVTFTPGLHELTREFLEAYPGMHSTSMYGTLQELLDEYEQ